MRFERQSVIYDGPETGICAPVDLVQGNSPANLSLFTKSANVAPQFCLLEQPGND
jgi:hypothetical protein